MKELLKLQQHIAEPIATVIIVASAAAFPQCDGEVLGLLCAFYLFVLCVTSPGNKVRPIVVRSCSRAGTHIKSPNSVLAI